MGAFEDYKKTLWDCVHDNCTLGELEEAEQRLKDSIIGWHPYPEEKPNGEEFSMKCYLVTWVGWRETPMIDIGWHDEFGWHKNHIEANRIDGVTAWAELPAPYRRENEDETKTQRVD